MDDREAILAEIAASPGGASPRSQVFVRSVPDTDLWDCFVERLTVLGGEIKTIEDLAVFCDRAFCDHDVLQSMRGLLGKPIQNVWDAEAGVTMCELAIAETGSLLISAVEGRARLASLAPPVHVALLRTSDLVASLEEGVAKLPSETSVLISGPSRTADIEGVMVRGVHGPKRLWVVPIPE